MSDRSHCPRCLRHDYEIFQASDGELGSRAVSHIECVVELAAENAELRRQVDEWTLILGSVSVWVDLLPKKLGEAIAEGKALAARSQVRRIALQAETEEEA